MAAAITVTPDEPHVGQPVVVAGTGFAHTHAVTVRIDPVGITLKLTTDNTGAFSSDAVADVEAQSDLPLDITVNDGTDTVTERVEVFQG